MTAPTTAPGDYLVAGVIAGNAAVNTPAGWTLARTTTNTTALRLAVFYRQVAASPPGSYAFTLSAASEGGAFVASYSGVDSVTPVENSSIGTNAASTSISAPTVTAATAPTRLVSVFGVDDANAVLPSTPTGMTSRVSVIANFTWDRLLMSDQALAVSGATGVRTSSWFGQNLLAIGSSLILKAGPPPIDPAVQLTWTVTPSTFADGYEVVRTGGGTVTTAISGRTTTSWTDTTTSATSGYTYSLTATAGNWRSSAQVVSPAACP